MNQLLLCPILAALLLTASGLAVAEALPDPTRPPIGIGAADGHDGQEDEQSAAGAVERGLQFVIIAPGRRAAIINGQNVELGAKYGDAKLVEINEGSVVLRDARGRKTLLTMFPGVEVKKKKTPSPQQAEEEKTEPTKKQAVEKATIQAAPQEGK